MDPAGLAGSGNDFLAALGRAYLAYRNRLLDANRVDFACLQRMVLELLGDPSLCADVTRNISYVIVDEYQDTNRQEGLNCTTL